MKRPPRREAGEEEVGLRIMPNILKSGAASCDAMSAWAATPPVSRDDPGRNAIPVHVMGVQFKELSKSASLAIMAREIAP